MEYKYKFNLCPWCGARMRHLTTEPNNGNPYSDWECVGTEHHFFTLKGSEEETRKYIINWNVKLKGVK